MSGSPSSGINEIYLPKMISFAWTAATSFSILPLKASTWLGVIVTLLGLGEALHALLAKIFHWYVVPGWTSLTVLISILGGATLVSIGVLGEYVGKLYEQTKSRPLYLVSQTVNIDSAQKMEVKTPRKRYKNRRKDSLRQHAISSRTASSR